jgi:hypothetical protein
MNHFQRKRGVLQGRSFGKGGEIGKAREIG